jgi:hypothetical protein
MFMRKLRLYKRVNQAFVGVQPFTHHRVGHEKPGNAHNADNLVVPERLDESNPSRPITITIYKILLPPLDALRGGEHEKNVVNAIREILERDFIKKFANFVEVLRHEGAIEKARSQMAVMNNNELARMNTAEPQSVAGLVAAPRTTGEFEVRAGIAQGFGHDNTLKKVEFSIQKTGVGMLRERTIIFFIEFIPTSLF